MTQDQIIFNMQSKLKIDSPMIMTGKVTNHFMICNLTINWDYNGAVIIILFSIVLSLILRLHKKLLYYQIKYVIVRSKIEPV